VSEAVSFDIPRDVRAFLLKAGYTLPEYGTVRDELPSAEINLIEALIDEEADELIAALRDGDTHQAAAEACDLLFSAVMALVLLGVPLTVIWPEMAASYLSKVEGAVVRDAKGKVGKPPGFVAADPRGAVDGWLSALAAGFSWPEDQEG
jgi:phosphoribosyl-ATP pyrophosphohydrolase